jgi:hypothetical protein
MRLSDSRTIVIDFDVKRWSDVSVGFGRFEWFETPKSIGRRQGAG